MSERRMIQRQGRTYFMYRDSISGTVAHTQVNGLAYGYDDSKQGKRNTGYFSAMDIRRAHLDARQDEFRKFESRMLAPLSLTLTPHS